MKQKVKELALQAGGSHYPEVGGEVLNKFADLLLEEVINTIKNTPKHCAHTTYDMSTVECTIKQSVSAVKDRFGV